MIITVTLNAAIDKTLAVPNFRLGWRHRAVEQTSMAGGKGVNVARALKALGEPVIATGVAGGPTGTRIIEQLTEEAILSDFVRIREESRTSTAVVDPTTGEQTEINERGPDVSAAELDLFRDKLLYLARGAACCVFSGSLPRGVPSDLYAQLVHELQRLEVTTVLDAEGEALRLGTRAVREMVELGAHEAILTLPTGCIGLVESDGERRLYRVTIDPALVDARSGVGSGDAFLAGYVACRYKNRPPEDCLRFAVACGAESVQHFGAGVLDSGGVDRLLPRVEIEELPAPAVKAGR